MPATSTPVKRGAKLWTLTHFVAFCTEITLDNGKPLKVEPFQRKMLSEFFAGTTETVIVLPKKNGKTTLIAALAIYALLHTPDAAIIVAAAARDQASILYDQASDMVRRSDWLDERIKIQGGYKRLVNREDGGTIQVIASDATTADGVIPTLVLADELHRWKRSELYSILRDGLGARGGRLIAISTAGDSEESPLGRIRAAALKLPGVRRDGVHTTVVSPNRQFVLHEWSLQPDDDVDDLKLVKQANPLSSNTLKVLKARKESPSLEPWQWARFTCGIWASGENSAIEVGALKRVDVGLDLEVGEPCWLGMDIGWRRDTTALVPFVLDEPNDDGVRDEVVGKPTILTPPGKGVGLHPDEILDAIRAIHERNPIEAIVFDPNAEGRVLASRISDELGIRIVEHSQDPAPMAQAAMGLAESIRAQTLVLPRDPELLAHLLAAAAKPIATGSDKWRFVKQPGGRPIDAAVALAIVRRARLGDAAKPKTRLTLDDYLYDGTAVAA